jgi:hypothetical protein
MLFVGGTDGHAENCYRMYNPVTSQVWESRDIIWCGQMYVTSENCNKTELRPVIVVLITNDVSNEDLTKMEVIKVTLPTSLEREGMAVVAKPQDLPSKEG